MANKLEEFQELGKTQLEAATTLSSSFLNNLQTIAAETTDYSKKFFEDSAALLEKLRGAKSFESAIEMQGSASLSVLEICPQAGPYINGA